MLCTSLYLGEDEEPLFIGGISSSISIRNDDSANNFLLDEKGRWKSSTPLTA